MNVYLFDYYYSFCGDFTELHCVVVAETESVALGLALENYPFSKGKYWTCTLVDISKRGVTD